MKKLILISIPALIAGCSSAPKYASAPETQPDVVIARIDNLDERPKWIKESLPFSVTDEKVVSLGSADLAGDGNLNAGYRICFNNAKSHIATAIEQKLEFIFQQGSEGTAIDSTTANFIGSEMSSLTTTAMRPTNQYFEKIATSDDSGHRKTVYKVFCTVEMPTPDFRRHLADAIRRGQGQGKVSADFKQKLDKQWHQFSQAPSDNREPSSNESAE